MNEQDVKVDIQPEPIVTEKVYMIDGVHVDLANYFNVYPLNLSTREKEQLNYIYENAPGDSIEDKMSYISQMEMRLGQPSDGSRFGKVWGWMKTMKLSKI